MTVDVVLDFCDRPDLLSWMICPKDVIFRLFSADMLTSDWAVLLEGCNIPSFICDNIDFPLGRPSRPVLKFPSLSSFNFGASDLNLGRLQMMITYLNDVVNLLYTMIFCKDACKMI